MHWTERRNAKTNIGEELGRRGWTLFGYHEDRSDIMTDYYAPASWDGVAEKDGYIIVVDVSATNGWVMDRAGKESGGVTWPMFQANPHISQNTNWHIEKDGQVLVSGVGLAKCADYDVKVRTKAIDRIVGTCERVMQQPEQHGPVSEMVIGIGYTLERNYQHQGMEIKFPGGKPDTNIITMVKQFGFRWSWSQHLWYRKYDENIWNKTEAALNTALNGKSAKALPEILPKETEVELHQQLDYDEPVVEKKYITSSEARAAYTYMPADIRAKMPKIRSTDQWPHDNIIVYLKYFSGSWTWYLWEFDGKDELFGLVEGFEIEAGYVSLNEIATTKGAMGLPIERDIWWEPTPLCQIPIYPKWSGAEPALVAKYHQSQPPQFQSSRPEPASPDSGLPPGRPWVTRYSPIGEEGPWTTISVTPRAGCSIPTVVWSVMGSLFAWQSATAVWIGPYSEDVWDGLHRACTLWDFQEAEAKEAATIQIPPEAIIQAAVEPDTIPVSLAETALLTATTLLAENGRGDPVAGAILDKMHDKEIVPNTIPARGEPFEFGPDFKVPTLYIPFDEMRSEGATHYYIDGTTLHFFRPAPMLPGRYGHKVVLLRDDDWHMSGPWILWPHDTLPEQAISIVKESEPVDLYAEARERQEAAGLPEAIASNNQDQITAAVKQLDNPEPEPTHSRCDTCSAAGKTVSARNCYEFNPGYNKDLPVGCRCTVEPPKPDEPKVVWKKARIELTPTGVVAVPIDDEGKPLPPEPEPPKLPPPEPFGPKPEAKAKMTVEPGPEDPAQWTILTEIKKWKNGQPVTPNGIVKVISNGNGTTGQVHQVTPMGKLWCMTCSSETCGAIDAIKAAYSK